MSVINKMLRDLEARRAAPASTTDGVHAIAVPRNNRRLATLLLLGGAAAGGAVFGDWPSLLAADAAAAPAPLQIVQNDDPPATQLASAPTAPSVAAAASPAEPPSETKPEVPALARPRASTTAFAPVEPALLPSPGLATHQNGKRSAPTAALAGDARFAGIAPAALPLRLAASARSETPANPASIDKRMATLPTAQRAQALYRQGLELASSGHGRQAVEQLQVALQLDASLVAARIHAVSLLLEQGRSAEAETLAREGLASSADEPQLNTLLARVLADRGDAAGALALLDRSERLGAEGLGLRAGLLSQQGNFSRALQDYEQAVRLQPGNSLWWLGLGVALEAEGRGQQARQVYGRAQAIGVERSDLNHFIDQKLQQLD